MKWTLLITTVVLFYLQVCQCSEVEGEEDSIEDFIGFGTRSGLGGHIHLESDYSGTASSATAAATSISGSGITKNYFDEILMDESVSISLNCEKSLGSSEDALKSFVMKSLDFTAEETLADLERPACRAFFDRNGHQLSKEQLGELMTTERGMKILLEGEVLEFFSDFSDFTLKDFSKFPSLKVGKIRDVSSISAEVLLTLVKQGGFTNAGRLERIPEHFGERVLEHEAWKLDPEIWQLFTLEGIAQVHSIQNVDKFAKFLADHSKFEKLIFFIQSGSNDFTDSQDEMTTIDLEHGGGHNEIGMVSSNSPITDPVTLRNRLRSSTITSDTSIRSTAAPTSTTSTSTCKSFAKNAPLLARWAVQTEELALYMMEMPEVIRGGINQLAQIQEGVKELMDARSWLRNQIRNRCFGAIGITEDESLYLGNLKALLDSPLAWRLKEALRLHIYAVADPQPTPSQMTQNLRDRLEHFPSVVDYYRPMYVSGTGTQMCSIAPNDHLLTHFFLVNEIDDLESIFGNSEAADIPAANEKLVLSIAIRRILLLLLSPSLDASNVIQDALNYVFSSQSPLLATSDSNEILRWFRQAQDLQAIPVLDRLIRNFGHEFDVSREIKSVLSDRNVRMKLFTEAQSNLVRLLVCLANGLSEHLVNEAPKILVSPYVDPANALLMKPVLPLPVHPNRRPYTQEEISAHENEVERVREHNTAINKALQTALRFLKTFSVFPDKKLSVNFAGFVQPNFRVHFSDNVGIDAGGLRRTWLSSLLRIFGDSQRMLFPQHVYGGRTPSALLDPEIMGHLGALHGKSLQVGVKPDWFFTPRYTNELLFAQEAPEFNELIHLTEELFPDIFAIFDSMLNLEDENYAVEYFNQSEFPSIAGLSAENVQGVVNTEAVNESLNESLNEDNVNENPDDNVSNVSNVSVNSNSSDNAELIDASAGNEANMQSPQIARTRSVDSADDTDNRSIDSVTRDIIHELNTADGVTVNPFEDTPPVTPVTPQSQAQSQAQQSSVPRHSFSRMLVFDVRYLAQEAIYSGPRAVVQTREDIQTYKASLLHLFAENLLSGRLAYRNAFSVFFDAQYRPMLEPEFLHTLLEPPVVLIDEVLTRVQFHRNCDEIYIIDDDKTESSESVDSKGSDSEIDESKSDVNDNDNDNINSETKRKSKSQSPPGKKSKTPLPRITNITARVALTRILQSLFLDQSSMRSLLSFSTGCPQLPPAGLDALRLTVHCYATGAKMSKSHTCSNTIDFFTSVGYKETKEAFKESVISSSGFGFD